MCLVDWIASEHLFPDPVERIGHQAIVRGETDGTMGMEDVKQLLNWNSNATLILSGGVYGRENSVGDVGAIDMFKHIEHDLSLYGYSPEKIKSRVIIDSFSEHTIDQARILAGILRAIKCRDFFVVVPLYHMPRFLLTLGAGLERLGIKPNIIPRPYGRWSTRHPRKGPTSELDKTYTYQELFASPAVPSRSNGKLDCGEVDKTIEFVKAGEAMTYKEFNRLYLPASPVPVQLVESESVCSV